MRKIFLITFLFLILFFTILTIYFSTIGIKTSKFNQLIKDKLIKIDSRLNAELEEVTLLLDLARREIKVETDNTNLYLDNNLIKDHRTKYETSSIQKVLDGNIDEYIKEYLLFNMEKNNVK